MQVRTVRVRPLRSDTRSRFRSALHNVAVGPMAAEVSLIGEPVAAVVYTEKGRADNVIWLAKLGSPAQTRAVTEFIAAYGKVMVALNGKDS